MRYFSPREQDIRTADNTACLSEIVKLAELRGGSSPPANSISYNWDNKVDLRNKNNNIEVDHSKALVCYHPF